MVLEFRNNKESNHPDHTNSSNNSHNSSIMLELLDIIIILKFKLLYQLGMHLKHMIQQIMLMREEDRLRGMVLLLLC